MFKLLRFRKKSDATAAGAASGTNAADDGAPRAGADARARGTPQRHDPHAALHGDADTLLQRLEWTVLRRLDGLLQGDYRTLLRGFGLDLADLREYQPQDDVRYIDWNVTARLGTPYVREFQEDREVTAWFLIDLSGSVDFGSRGVKKRELASELTGVLARLLTRRGNRVGAILKGQSATTPATVIPVRGGRRQVLHLLDTIQLFAVNQAALKRDEKPDAKRDAKIKANSTTQNHEGTTDLSLLLREAYGVIKRRSVVFVLSDFISTPGWEVALAQLARRHEVIAVRLYDPVEQNLPELGFVMLEDAETGEQLFLDTQDRGFRARFAKLAEQRETTLREAFAQSGVDCMELATTDHLQKELLRFIDLRKRRSRLAAGGGLRAPLVASLRA